MADATFTLDPITIQNLVQQAVQTNIISTVENMVQDVSWLNRIEKLISQTTIDKTLARINSVNVDNIIDQYISKQIKNISVDQNSVQQLMMKSIQDKILSIINDPAWIEKMEKSVNQNIVHESIARISSIDITSIIKERVDDNNVSFRQGFVGINDQATSIQLTTMDDVTVVENNLTTRELTVVDGAVINNLAVKGSINTDNQAWDDLADNISKKTLASIEEQWRDNLIQSVTTQIKTNGINFDEVKVNDNPVFSGNMLGNSITESKLQTLGVLRGLKVAGESNFNNTLSVLNKRIGINTESPEMALSVWDEEVTVNIGKFKSNQAYIGTSRPQGLSLGVNRIPQIDISIDGITTINKLRVGLHMISHSIEVPGWAGTRGDIVFNASPKDDPVFGWVCLGGFKWKTLKGAE